MLRSEKLPNLEDVCAQIQREHGSMGLFGGKGDLPLANAAQSNREESPQANKAGYKKYEDRKFNGNCDHCKKYGHKKSQCWILHPHLKPAKFLKEKEAKAHMTEGSSGAGPSNQGTEVENHEGNGKALVINPRGNDQDFI
uniref:CCHC-type domain-containing protein n=1 Tax=Brassica oleracea var. oleracea TaxID=109376 RepID=A0A0D2ZZE7_BRAOL